MPPAIPTTTQPTIENTCLTLVRQDTGEVLRLRRVRDADGQIILTLDGSLPPKAQGPPPHIHFHQLEEGTVKAGTLGARVGNRTITVPTGGRAVLPAGVVHTWWNAGEDLLEFSGRAVPAGDLDRYLQAIFAVVNAGLPGRPPLFYIAHVLWRHRRNQVLTMPPVFVQRIVFPLVIALGHLLGKYRGDDWPGSPASCHGAPEA